MGRGYDLKDQHHLRRARFGKLRTQRALTQEVLAERTELSVSYFGFIERRENVPTLTIVLDLAEALDVEAADLVREVSLKR